MKRIKYVIRTLLISAGLFLSPFMCSQVRAEEAPRGTGNPVVTFVGIVNDTLWGDIGIDNSGGSTVVGFIGDKCQEAAESGSRMHQYYSNFANEIGSVSYGSKTSRDWQSKLVSGASEMADKNKTAEMMFGSVKQVTDYAGVFGDVYGATADADHLLSGETCYDSETLENAYNGLIGANLALTGMEKYPPMKPLAKIPKEIVGWVKDFMGSETLQNQINNNDTVMGWLKGADEFSRSFNAACIEMFGGDGGEYYAQQYAKRQARKDAMRSSKPVNGAGVYKPNIYIYPEVVSNIRVEFPYEETLTCTIPDYRNAWEVTALPGGDLYTNNERYDYLFYESITDKSYYQTEEGFVIHADDRKETLARILNKYGLSQEEIDDFTDYWDERLEDNTTYVMYPQLNDTVDLAMPIIISPTPDSILRIWFVFNEYKTEQVIEPTVVKFERNGYSVVEWGGLLY